MPIFIMYIILNFIILFILLSNYFYKFAEEEFNVEQTLKNMIVDNNLISKSLNS